MLNAIDRFFDVKTCIWIVSHHIHHHRASSILFHGILSKNNIWPVRNNIELVCTMSTTGITYTQYGLFVFLALWFCLLTSIVANPSSEYPFWDLQYWVLTSFPNRILCKLFKFWWRLIWRDCFHVPSMNNIFLMPVKSTWFLFPKFSVEEIVVDFSSG